MARKKWVYSRNLRMVAEVDGFHCWMCRTRLTVGEKPLSDAERQLGWQWLENQLVPPETVGAGQ